MSELHTPGPWKAEREDGVWRVSVPSPGPDFMIVCEESNKGRDHAKANARLIAAAPDLLAACKGSLMQMSLSARADGTPTDAHLAILNAIAKAEALGGRCQFCHKDNATVKEESPSGRYTTVRCRFCNRFYGYGE